MESIRLLRADEIEVRVQEIKPSAKGHWYVSLMLYKTARTDMKLLDEVFGSMNWQNRYRSIDKKMYCEIEVWDDEKKCWIHKENVGTEANMEAEKSEASDAMKRAGFLWGIGRELYTPLQIKVYEPYVNVIKVDDKKGKTYDRFYVKEIGYNEEARKITDIVICNATLKCECYRMENGIVKTTTEPTGRNVSQQEVQSKASTQKTQQNASQKPVQAGAHVCVDCGAEISDKVANYSVDVYGDKYCYNCQKKHQRIAKSA